MKKRPIRAAFREGSNASEALAMDRRLFGANGPTAGGFMFDIPPPLQHVVDDGIAVLSIQGPLEHHTSWLWHSYEEILLKAEEAFCDGEASRVVLKIDSPGGVCAGLGETRKALRALSKRYGKPLYSYAAEMACSAAYDLACAAVETWLPEAGQLGSIGVILCTVDETKRLEKEGYAVRYVTSGARKADMHPGSPITDEVLEVAQAKVDHLAGLFFRSVARSREMSPEAVEALQAGVFCGFDAVQAGLADGVAGWPKFLGYIRSGIRATTDPLRATPSAASARHTGKGPQMKKKILKLTQRVEDARSAVTKAQKLLAKADGGSEKKKALAALETALTEKIAASAALSSAHASPRSKTVTEKHSKVTVDAEDEEDEEDETKEEDEEDDAEAEDAEGEEDDDGDDEEEDDEESTGAESEEEEDDEEEKAIAKAFSAKASGEGLYTPYRLARVVKQATGCKTIKEAFGALAAMGPRLAAVKKTEDRVAKLEGESRKNKVDAILATAKLDGRVVGKAHRDSLRADGMKHGSKWLKAHVAVLPKQHKTLAEGGFVPRAGTDGNPIGAPGSDTQKMDAAATAGMSAEDAAKYREQVAKKINAGASRNPSH